MARLRRRMRKPLTGSFHLGVFLSALFFTSSCKTRGSVDKNISIQNRAGNAGSHDLPAYQDFCDLQWPEGLSKPARTVAFDKVRVDSPLAGEPQFWSRVEIEENIQKWKRLVTQSAQEPLKKIFLDEQQKKQGAVNRASVILTAYGTAYLKMTAVRDQERCKNAPANTSDVKTHESKMVSEHHLVNMLNHGLADLMTRNIVNISQGCLLETENRPGYALSPEKERWEFCDLYYDTALNFRNSYNSMTVAMSSTMIYLTSHISGALSALPFLDRLWVGTEFQGHGGFKGSGAEMQEIWNKRILFIERNYKPSFDFFNSFLSQNVDTVAQALAEDGQVKTSDINQISEIIETKSPLLTAFISLIFDQVRSESFKIGIKMAQSLANEPLVRESVSKTLSADQERLEIHPFLERRVLGAAMVDAAAENFYYEIRSQRPQFSAALLGLKWVQQARNLTWKHRVDVESWPVRRIFKAFGAVGYFDGFNPEMALKKGFIARFFDMTGCFDLGLRRSFDGKAEALGLSTKDWDQERNMMFKMAKDEVVKAGGTLDKDSDTPSTLACKIPQDE